MQQSSLACPPYTSKDSRSQMDSLLYVPAAAFLEVPCAGNNLHNRMAAVGFWGLLCMPHARTLQNRATTHAQHCLRQARMPEAACAHFCSCRHSICCLEAQAYWHMTHGERDCPKREEPPNLQAPMSPPHHTAARGHSLCSNAPWRSTRTTGIKVYRPVWLTSECCISNQGRQL